MTHVCCPGCGLRFTGAVAVSLPACPDCGDPPQSAPSAEHVLGLRLWTGAGRSDSGAIAVTLALARHDAGISATVTD